MKRGISIVLVVIFILVAVSGCGDDGKIRVPKSASECKGKDYLDVKALFESAGFTNVNVRAIEDLVTGWITKDGSVERVSINGDDDFSSSAKFDPSVEVIIVYHTFPPKSDPTPTPKPTAAPTSTPNVTVAPVELAKASIEDVKQTLYDLLADYYEYVVVNGDETSISVNIAESGTALAAFWAKSNNNFAEWREMKKAMQGLSESAYKLVKDSGYENTIVFLNLLNDQNKENVLLMYMNGVLISDAIDN